MEPKPQTKLCKKIIYGNETNPTVLLGIVENDTEGFITFRTARKEYMISKNSIISLEDTDIPFRSEGGDHSDTR